MKVKCMYNDPDNPPPNVSSRFNFGLEIGKEYLVMAIMLTENTIRYLIDEGGHPNFFPNQLFVIVDHSIAPNWYFRIFDSAEEPIPNNKSAMWGYYEIVHERGHYSDLVLSEEEGMRLYFRRKIELEKILREEL